MKITKTHIEITLLKDINLIISLSSIIMIVFGHRQRKERILSRIMKF